MAQEERGLPGGPGCPLPGPSLAAFSCYNFPVSIFPFPLLPALLSCVGFSYAICYAGFLLTLNLSLGRSRLFSLSIFLSHLLLPLLLP